jgi:hypothetical protein
MPSHNNDRILYEKLLEIKIEVGLWTEYSDGHDSLPNPVLHSHALSHHLQWTTSRAKVASKLSQLWNQLGHRGRISNMEPLQHNAILFKWKQPKKPKPTLSASPTVKAWWRPPASTPPEAGAASTKTSLKTLLPTSPRPNWRPYAPASAPRSSLAIL